MKCQECGMEFFGALCERIASENRVRRERGMVEIHLPIYCGKACYRKAMKKAASEGCTAR